MPGINRKLKKKIYIYPQMTLRDTDGGPQADGELGGIMITDSSDWTDVRRRTMWVNANYRELNVN